MAIPNSPDHIRDMVDFYCEHNLGGSECLWSECLECLVPLWPVSGWRRAGQGGRAGPGIDHAATGDRMG